MEGAIPGADGAGESDPTTTTRAACERCGVEGEGGGGCSACGAHLSHAAPSPADRLSGVQPSPERYRLHHFRWVLVAGLLGVVATLLIGNVGLATVLAALVVPLLSVAYVHHVGAPMAALASVASIGGLAGVGLALLSRQYLGHLPLVQIAALAQGRPPLSLVLLLGITLPLVGELLKLAGPLLILRRWPRHRDTVMDGVVFGVASGMGFAAASTLVNYWPIIQDGYALTGAAAISEWTAALVGLAILRPLVHGATSGLIGAGIWAATLRRGRVTLPVVFGLGGAVVYSVGDLLLLSRGTPAVLTLHGLLLVILLIALRRTIRAALLVDAHALGVERGMLVCQSCRRATSAGVFCAHCGAALSAQPHRPRAG